MDVKHHVYFFFAGPSMIRCTVFSVDHNVHAIVATHMLSNHGLKEIMQVISEKEKADTIQYKIATFA